MSNDSVFLIYCELSGNSRRLRSQGLAGAFVTCVIATNEIISAIREAEYILKEDGYELVDIDKAMRFEREEWDDDEIITLVSEVQQDHEPRYSTFQTWGH